MSPYHAPWHDRLHTARRIFSLIPIVVFFLSLMIFAQPIGDAPFLFVQMLLRGIVTALASSFVCMAAYGFYRYLIERSPGL
ncbi:MAG: hypothetical protein IVW55_02850 [Chloroflexi bacterium]|nr:hypothetical protein [Chloroflexota bacterium]